MKIGKKAIAKYRDGGNIQPGKLRATIAQAEMRTSKNGHLMAVLTWHNSANRRICRQYLAMDETAAEGWVERSMVMYTKMAAAFQVSNYEDFEVEETFLKIYLQGNTTIIEIAEEAPNGDDSYYAADNGNGEQRKRFEVVDILDQRGAVIDIDRLDATQEEDDSLPFDDDDDGDQLPFDDEPAPARPNGNGSRVRREI